jgi:hypothetical protein
MRASNLGRRDVREFADSAFAWGSKIIRRQKRRTRNVMQKSLYTIFCCEEVVFVFISNLLI